MDDVEFEPYDEPVQKRIGEGHKNDQSWVEKKPNNKNTFRPFILVILICIVITACVFSYLYYQSTILNRNKTTAELLEIKNALFLYKESIGNYPNKLVELAKGRP